MNYNFCIGQDSNKSILGTVQLSLVQFFQNEKQLKFPFPAASCQLKFSLQWLENRHTIQHRPVPTLICLLPCLLMQKHPHDQRLPSVCHPSCHIAPISNTLGHTFHVKIRKHITEPESDRTNLTVTMLYTIFLKQNTFRPTKLHTVKIKLDTIQRKLDVFKNQTFSSNTNECPPYKIRTSYKTGIFLVARDFLSTFTGRFQLTCSKM